MRKILICVMACVLATVAAGCKKFNAKDNAFVPVTGISLDENDITLLKDNGIALNATLTPSNTTQTYISWSSSSPSVASVDNGFVRALSTGVTNIIATAANPEITATCRVTVVNEIIPVTGITVSPGTVVIKSDGTARVSASFTPGNTTQRRISWSVDDPSVASVDDNGYIKGLSIGETLVWAESKDNPEVKASAAIRVVKPFESITVTNPANPATPTDLGCDETLRIRYTFTPADSGDEAVFAVSKGSSSCIEVSQDGTVRAKAYSSDVCKIVVSSKTNPEVFAEVSFRTYDAPSGIEIWNKGYADRRTMYIGNGYSQTYGLRIKNSSRVKPGTGISMWGPDTYKLHATLNEAGDEMTVGASASTTSTSSSKVSGNIKLYAGDYPFDILFYISEYDAFHPKIGDIIYYSNQKILTADSGYRGGGIYESPVSGPNDSRLGIIGFIGDSHLSEDPVAASYNLPGIGDSHIHGIAIPYNTSYVCRKTKPGGDFSNSCWSSIPSSNQGGEIFSKDHDHIINHGSPGFSGYDQSRLRYSTTNSTKRLAFHNTVGLLYYNLDRGDSHRVHQVLYVSSNEALEPFGGSNSGSVYTNSNAYYFGRSSSNDNLNYTGYLSTAPAYKKITPWLFPTIADLKTVFAGAPGAADNNSTVAATVKEHETVFSKAVALFSINKNANYLDYTYWTSQEYSDYDAMALYIKNDGTLSAANWDKNETHKFLPVFYF